MLIYFDGDEAFRIERDQHGHPSFVSLFGTDAQSSWEVRKVGYIPFLDDTTQLRIARRVFGERWSAMLTDSGSSGAAEAMEGMVRDAVRRFNEAAGALPPLPTPATPNDYSFIAARIPKVLSRKRRKEYKEAVAARLFDLGRLRQLIVSTTRSLDYAEPFGGEARERVSAGLGVFLEAQREHWRAAY